MKLILSSLLLFLSVSYGKQNICTVTINSNHEREAFRANLNPIDFDFIELTDFSTDKEKNSNDWFDQACERKVECDVLVISGHFGGQFFGHTKFTLGLGDLENRSCQNRCPGILNKPKEVFLFGCNTLASKDLDHRTPQQYYTALVQHDISPTEAERIVAARYSPIGSSNRDRMRRIFEGVPLIYGFSSVGPAGNHIKPQLNKYFSELGDYKAHLASISKASTDNPVFKKHMKAYTTAVSSGIGSSEGLSYDVKVNSCKLTDPKIDLEDRVDLAANILEKSPYTYFPTVSKFMADNFLFNTKHLNTAKALEKFSSRTDLKNQIMKISLLGGLGPTLQMDILKFSMAVKWINQNEYQSSVKKIFKDLMMRPTLESADTFCSVSSEVNEQFEWSIKDIPENFESTNPNALKMLGCVDTKDIRVTELALKSAKMMDLNSLSVEQKFGVYYALANLQGLEDEIAQFFKEQPKTVGRYEKEAERARQNLILRKIRGPEQAALYKQLYATYTSENNTAALESLDSALGENKYLTSESKTVLLLREYKACTTKDYCNITAEFVRNDLIIQKWTAEYLDLKSNPKFTSELLTVLAFGKTQVQPQLTAKLLTVLAKDSSITNVPNISSILEKTEFSENLVNQVRQLNWNIPKENKNGLKPALRYYLYKHKSRIPDLSEFEVSGHKEAYFCKMVGEEGGYTCSQDIIN